MTVTEESDGYEFVAKFDHRSKVAYFASHLGDVEQRGVEYQAGRQTVAESY